ncbi:MAG: hypothetical protein IJW37_00730 [Lachnospiraceae bacterium]|nr:hypothetical protein [Lachnospiraceae bacterium]
MFESNQENSYELYTQNRLQKDGPLLAKWLWILFWVAIAGFLPSILSLNYIKTVAPVIYYIGDYGAYLFVIAYTVVLLFLRRSASSYGRAGLFSLIGNGISIVLAVVFTLLDRPLPNLLALPVLVLTLMSEYHEFKAHSEVLEGVDYVLSEKWTKLWRAYILALVAIFLSSFIFLPIISTLIELASLIAVLVCMILKYCYLYRTATVFRTHQREHAENNTISDTTR